MKHERAEFIKKYIRDHNRPQPTTDWDWRVFLDFFESEFRLRGWNDPRNEIQSAIERAYVRPEEEQ